MRARSFHRTLARVVMERQRDRSDHPAATMVVGLLFASFVALVQLAKGGGDPSAFVSAAPPWADPGAVPAGLHVGSAPYDGVFYYRLALDPLTDRQAEHGITFDRAAYRQQRILYPALAWAVSGGDAMRVPLALVVVNVAALAAVGWVGGAIARGAGRHALWGALFVLHPGFVVTLTNDLTEAVAAAPVLLAVLLLRRERWLAGAAALTLAQLARETSALLAAATGLTSFAAAPRSPGRWLPFALPALAAVGWQVALAIRWHAAPIGQSGEALAPPLLGLLAAAAGNGRRLGPADAVVWVATVAFVLALLAIGARALGAPARAHERAAWWAYAAVAVVLEANIWANAAVLRTLTELALITALLALGSTARARAALLGLDVALAALLVATG